MRRSGTGRRGGRGGAARRAAAGGQRTVALPMGVGAPASGALLAVFSEVYLLDAARGGEAIGPSEVVALKHTRLSGIGVL